MKAYGICAKLCFYGASHKSRSQKEEPPCIGVICIFGREEDG